MADIPAAALAAGAEAVNEAHAKRGWNKPAPWWTTEVATAVLDAAAPLLAEAVAQKILAHAEEHDNGLKPANKSVDRILQRAWRRHFGIAARVAALAFYTDEDIKRLATEAVERGDYLACRLPEEGQ